MAGVTGGLHFSDSFLAQVAARNDPKCPAGWHVQYAERVQRDFEELRPFLDPANRLMDIGCGFAGVDVLIARHARCATVHLLDGAGHGPRQTGMQDVTMPWNDVRLAATLMRDNVGCKVKTSIVPPTPASWSANLIISLKSWGHHYPISTYLSFVRTSLDWDGYLIIDIRKGSDGRQTLEAGGLYCLQRIGGTDKCDRFIFEHDR